jgi:hypothetical protein
MIKNINCKLIFSLLLVFSSFQLNAQNNWDGDNPLGNFGGLLFPTYCNNWSTNNCPATWNSTTDLFFNSKNNAAQTTMYLDYGTWKDCNNIIYQATYLAGLPFDADGSLNAENGLNFYGKIENYSPNFTHTFNTIQLSGKNATVIELNPIFGGLTFNRPIYNTGNKPFNVYGQNSKKLTLNSYPEGNNAVGFYIKEYSIVEVNYNNPASLSGGFFVEQGELWVEALGVIQGGIQVGNATANVNKLYISNPTTATTVANAITVPANSSNTTIGSLNTTNTHTYSGAINLNNNAVNFDVVSAGGTVNFTNTISGTGGIQKIGPGLAMLSAANSYTGNTTINAGTLQYGVANPIANTSNVILNGGRLSTGAAAGFSDTVGTLQLTDNSTIELGTGNHILTFAASNGVGWTSGRTLTITGWTNSCTGAKVFVGNSNTGLTATQLAQITFQGYAPGASISPIGELIPGNVVLTATGAILQANYATLKACFDAINLGTHTGVITISVLNDINEGAASAVLNNNIGVTSVLIQPAGCGPRTITGTGTAGFGAPAVYPVVYFNGADNVTVDGLNTNGNSLTISNTTISAAINTCTVLFQNDATNNTITNCTILGSSTSAVTTAGGNIWFGALSAITGNDNNTISNCNIGPAGGNLPSKAICFTGTPGTPNDNITIINNNIYDFFSASGTSSGIDLTNLGTSNVSITNNRFYQTATRTQTTGSTHSCIRIGNASGNNFNVTGNIIGYSSSAGTGTYNFVGITGSVFNPIMLSVGATVASSIQNNRIAGISYSTSTAVFSAIPLFNAIVVTGSGNLNIGNTIGNRIGLAGAPITFDASAGAGGTVNAINMTGTGAVAIQNNTVQAITTTGVAGAAFNVTGITVAGAAAYTITNNTIGNVTPANSINLGVLGTSTIGSTFVGINSTSTGSPLNIGASGFANFIQNITFNANAANAFNGIVTSGANATTNITYNSIRGIRFTSVSPTPSVFTGISNTGAVTSAISISNNSLGIAGTDLVTYTAATSGLFRGITNTGGAGTATLSIASNDFRGIVHTVAATAVTSHNFIINTAATLSQDISSNTFTNLNVNSTGGIVFFTNSVLLGATGTKNMNSNSIVGTFVKGGATGSLTLYSDTALSVAGASIINTNNNLSNITVSGTTAVTGWHSNDGTSPSPTKTITGNTFSNWSLGSSAVTVLNANALGGTLSSVSSNTISNITSTGAITGLNIGVTGTATALSVNFNTITTLTSSGAGGAVVGISNGQPATTLTNNTNTNTISGLSSTAGAVSGIINTSASPTKSMSNNNIATLSNTGNTATAISSSNGTTVVIDTNTISGISSTSTVAGSIVSAISVTGGATISITNNPISTLSSANNGSFRGIFVSPLGATSNNITGNTINGMTSTSTGAGSSVRGIEVGGSGNATINNNNISNINAPTTNVTAGLGIPIVGLYYGSTGAGSTITGNTISGINATTAGAINVSVAAIVTGTSGGGTIAKNRIYGLTNLKSGATANTIGFVPNGGNWTFANNMISITNNNTVRAIGVFDAGAAGARNYFYNSIYIGGTHAGTQVSNAFQFNNAGTGTADIKNNIFVMARTSGAKNYAFANTGANFTGLTTNYNVLNCTVASTIGLTNATDRDFAAWKTASGGDTNSYSGIVVSFIDTATADLHLTPSCTDIESGGTPVATLDDYDAAARSVTTPDIGADEFAGTRPADITLTPNTAICSGSTTTLTASSIDATYAYTWTPATGLSATTGATVTANPIVTTTYIVTGTSPSSCVKIKEVVVSVNPLPVAITVSPTTAAICPNTIQAFTAAPNLGTAIVGTDTGTSLSATTPYQQSALITSEVRTQYLITRAELNAAGMSGGNITSLGFTVKTVGVAAMPSYIISMANTLNTSLTATYITTGFSTVFTGTNILPVFGLNTHTFQTPFLWDGTSNIVVNICHTSSGSGTLSGVAVSTFAVAMTNKRSGGGVCSVATSIAGTSTIRPMMTIGYENPITWSPTTDLYTDALATTVYNPLVHLNQPTIYAKSSIPRVYTATLTTAGTGCTRTSTGTITFAGSTWDGTSWSPSVPTGNSSLTFAGNYTSSGNLSGCSCTVTGGDVVFNGPDALILDNSLTVTAPGTIKFNNNSSLVQIDDTATNTGIITMERITPPIYRFDYTYWGSPVTLASNFTLGMLSPLTLSDKYFSWTPTIADGAGNWFSESAATVMNPTKGYIVRGPQTYSFTPDTKIPYTANFIGTPNNGVISAPIYHGTIVAPGPTQFTDDWNLLGNPYPSAVSALSFLSHPTNTPIIDGTIYFWTHNSSISSTYLSPFYGTFLLNYNNSDYATWNRVGAVGSAAGTGGPVPGGFIAAGQGFFTKSTGTAPSGNSVIFNNSMRVAGSNSQFYRMAFPPHVPQENNSNDPIERQRLWLNLSDESGAFNQILIGYVEGATTGWDSAFDGVRLTDQTSATLYSNLEDKKLVIQGRPLPFQETDEVPLGYRVNISGNNTFAIDRVDDSFSGQNIYIEDRVLDIVHNLRVSPYTFASEAGTFNDRFVLRYTDASLSANEFDANHNVTAFIFSNELQVKSSKNIVAIEVFDISGKLIQKYQPMELALEFKSRFNFAQGVYLAKIKLDNGIEVTKKVIH